ncbi:unnamed protein product, partial [Allacma fusca]
LFYINIRKRFIPLKNWFIGEGFHHYLKTVTIEVGNLLGNRLKDRSFPQF